MSQESMHNGCSPRRRALDTVKTWGVPGVPGTTTHFTPAGRRAAMASHRKIRYGPTRLAIRREVEVAVVAESLGWPIQHTVLGGGRGGGTRSDLSNGAEVRDQQDVVVHQQVLRL